MHKKNNMSNVQSNKPKSKIWRYMIVIFVIIITIRTNSINMPNTIKISKWDTYNAVRNKLSRLDRTFIKTYIKTHGIDLPNLQPWTLNFTWSYTSSELIALLSKWPEVQNSNRIKITILEWRNIYDIDKTLTTKWLIQPWEYISYVSSSQNISDLKNKYSYISSDATTLEWYLYPDTYIINDQKPAIEQLIKLQLENFQTRIWDNYQFLFNKLWDSLTADAFGFKLSSYSVLKLASVIENEEKNNNNKSTIAWIFLNRIKDGMRLDADYTICYWYKTTYDQCTPNFIVSKLDDNANPYNTRRIIWLPPTPINSPTVSSIAAVLKYNLNEYHYYLHASDWQIYYAKNLTEHNDNKNRYLK